jgi:hypothetical protein
VDDLRMIETLLTKPGPAEDVTVRGRERLAAATRETTRRRRLTWRLAAPAAALTAAATVAAVAVTHGSPTATPNGPPAAAASGRRILLAAAVTAEGRPAGTGTYWHVKTVYSDHRSSETFESWTRRDGREYARYGPGRPVLSGGAASAFGLPGAQLTFAQIQRLPADPAALRARLAHMIRTAKNRVSAGHVVGPGRDPQLIESLTDLLARVPAPPKVRAAAFRAIASLPGVSRAGSAPGGQTLLIHGDAGDVRMIVDPATSLVRGYTATPPSPLPRHGGWLAAQSITFPVAEWTSAPPR